MLASRAYLLGLLLGLIFVEIQCKPAKKRNAGGEKKRPPAWLNLRWHKDLDGACRLLMEGNDKVDGM